MSAALARTPRILRSSNAIRSVGLLRAIVSMPALSPTMTSGGIGAWQKKPGETISPGDVLVEIETDKAQMDFEFQDEGVLAKILKQTGERDVTVGNPIAVVVGDEGDVAAFADFTLAEAGGESKPGSPKEDTSEASEPPKQAQSTPTPSESDQPGYTGRLETALERMGSGKASPAARALSAEKGTTTPTGAAAAAASKDIPLTSMRKTIALRLTESKNTSPHYYVQSSLSVGKLLKLRQALNSAANGEYKLSVNDFLIKAVAAALLKVPQVNSSYRESEGIIKEYNTADISVAVATPVGLMTPIVQAAHVKGLAAISKEVKVLSGKARDGKLKPEEYQGGTFTISNMGMNPAVERFTAVINPPQAGILAVGTVKKVAVEGKDGGVEFDEQIIVSGSFDHRVVDGAVGAEFMKELKKIVENPLELLL